jgi:predicted ATP-binding protein involved in virulence
MKLSSIKLKNFKVFEDKTIFFDKNLTVLVGKNGAGKSSVLEAISITLSWFIARIQNSKSRGEYISKEHVRNGSKKGAFISASFNEEHIEEFSILIPSLGNSSEKTNVTHLNGYCKQIRDKVEQSESKCSIPVFVNYGVRRAVVDIPLRIKKTHNFELFSTYDNSLRSDSNFRTFFEWYRNQEEYENELYRRHSLWNPFEPDRELEAIRHSISKFMPDFKNLTIRRKPLLRMTIDKNGETFSINQLSDGEKIYIALVGDLCRRLVLANPTLDNPLLGEGIVLIDEVDLHLHPEWQKNIAERLCATFPNIQFIITTHSPLVINSINTKHIRIINIENNKANIIEGDYSYGLPVSIILEDVMGISSELPKEIKERLDSAYDSLDEGDLDKAKSILEELQSLAPKLPDLVRIRKFIEIKSRK